MITTPLAAGVAAYFIASHFVEPPPPGDHEIKVTSYPETWFDRFNVHGSELHKLQVGKHTFKSVVGKPPYYIELPEIQAILFVQTQNHYRSSQKVVLYYFNRTTIIFDDRQALFPSFQMGDEELSISSCSETEIVFNQGPTADAPLDELCKILAEDRTFGFDELWERVLHNLKTRNVRGWGDLEQLRPTVHDDLKDLVSRGLVENTGEEYKGSERVLEASTEYLATQPGYTRTYTFNIPSKTLQKKGGF
ncbi:hypothetical protein [Haloferula sp. BvORR071]|uniref:hypothetical protein n=1 Tax=Haloferula sp. BvORR071 TaxID=1396141 RepID=UPI002240F793|nr:hypothetical protein [Haloferula sp. BvORR071]